MRERKVVARIAGAGITAVLVLIAAQFVESGLPESEGGEGFVRFLVFWVALFAAIGAVFALPDVRRMTFALTTATVALVFAVRAAYAILTDDHDDYSGSDEWEIAAANAMLFVGLGVAAIVLGVGVVTLIRKMPARSPRRM